MTRKSYSTTGTLRTELPRIETSFGPMAYWQSLQFGDYGRLSLGSFDCPYDGKNENTITVNRVEYSGDIGVYVQRDSKTLALDFNLHRKGDWRATPSDAAMRKIEAELLPLANELFPLPTVENISQAIFDEASREMYSAASSAIHKLSMRVYHDTRYRGHAEDVKAGVQAGLERAIEAARKETFETNTRY